MSTKTTFKRIALVAVAAMGFGLLSVVPSSAAHTYQADVLSVSAATSAITMGSTASVTVTQAFIAATTQTATDSITVTASFTAAPVGTVAGDLGDFVFSAGSNTSNNVGTRAFSVDPIAVSAYTSASYTIKLTPTVAGTYVVKFNPVGAGSDTQALNATAQTWTVTVAAAAAAGVADATSTALMAKGVTALSAGSADDTVSVPMAVGTTAVAVIDVTPLITTTIATTGSTSVTAVLTGAGTMGISETDGTSAASVGKSFTFNSTHKGRVFIYVWADGTSGTASIAISLGSVAIATKTVKFYGAAASVTTTQMATVVDSGSGAAAIGVLVATVKDANGTTVPGAALHVVSSSAAVFASTTATTGSAGTVTISYSGVAAGTATLTVQNVAAGSTATFSAPAVSVRAGSKVASSVTLTLDKATYSQGEAAVLTVTVKDAAGNLVAAGTQDIFTAAGATSTRVTAGATLPGASFTSAGSAYGVTTYKINVPTTSGAFTISATGGADLGVAQAGLAISVTATVSQTAAEIANADAIAAAADAAAEATDAANAATDAANAAAEAADAATAAAQDAADAVATLGTQVAELVAGLKAQIAAQKAAITALTNLVIKIQKKLKA